MKIKYLILLAIIGLLIVNSSCNSLENMTTSSVKLIITDISGTSLDGRPDSTTVFSDVLCGSSTVRSDQAKLVLSAVPINPLQDKTTLYQNVIVDQVDVEYSRTEDGRKVQGVDVPFAFSQKVNLLIRTDISMYISELSIILVQHVAKLESPLVELRTWTNQEKVLKLEAKITVYARDIAGNRLEPVSGTISVWCGNFDDECQ